jgi:hypothetical protein
MVMLRAKLGAAAGAVKNFFTGGKSEQDPAVAAMEALRVSDAPDCGLGRTTDV